MIEDEDGASDEERAQAEALARALEGEPASAPEEVVQTAALLRASRGTAELSGERARAVYAGLEPAIEHYVHARRTGTLRALAGLGAALAAAMALALLVTREEPRSAEAPTVGQARGLPTPSSELLSAQAALGVEGAPEATRAAFEREMRAYRAELMRALKAAYPAELSVLRAARPQ